MAAVFPIADFTKDLTSWINRIVVHITQGSAKVRTKRDRKLADLRKRGLAPEEEKPGEGKEEKKDAVAEKKNIRKELHYAF